MFHAADKATVAKIVRENIAKELRLHTDESKLYVGSSKTFAAHETVNHCGERIRSQGWRIRRYRMAAGHNQHS